MREIEIENWVTMKEAQAHLGVRRETISKWISTQGLPAYKIGRVWKFKLSEIDEWVRAIKGATPTTGTAGESAEARSADTEDTNA